MVINSVASANTNGKGIVTLIPKIPFTTTGIEFDDTDLAILLEVYCSLVNRHKKESED